MPYYESVLIARQEVGVGEAERIGEHYEELLGKEGASVVRREYWGLRRLAYRVRKNRKGHYLMFHVDGPGTAIQEFERQLRIDENVVRYLTMRLEQLPDEPSIIMKARLEREERRDQESVRKESERRSEEAEKKDSEATKPADGETAVEAAAPVSEGTGSAASGETAGSAQAGEASDDEASVSGASAGEASVDEAPAGGASAAGASARVDPDDQKPAGAEA